MFHSQCHACANLTPLSQKIDKLKEQLSALADLVQPLDEDDEELDEEEMDVLKDSGILPNAGSSRRKQKAVKRKHIVFAENEDEGPWCIIRSA